MTKLFSRRFNYYMLGIVNGFKPVQQDVAYSWWNTAVGETERLIANMGWNLGMYKRG